MATIKNGGVNVKFSSNGNIVMSFLGNVYQKHADYVNEVLNMSKDIVADVAWRHLRGLSSKSNKAKSSFFKRANDTYGGKSDLVYSNAPMRNIGGVRKVATQTREFWLNLKEFPVLEGYLLGVPPHDIYPREKKWLRFVWKGELTFAKHVYHPGIQKHPEVMFEIHRKALRRVRDLVRLGRYVYDVGKRT